MVYTLARKSYLEKPDQSELLSPSLWENPRHSSPNESVPILSNLIVIWDVIVVLWIFTHTVLTGVLFDDPGYDWSCVMISYRTCTGQRYFPVHHWVTVTFLTPFICVLNFGVALSSRCMHSLLCIIMCCFLLRFFSPLFGIHVQLFSPLVVVKYSHDCMLKKRILVLVVQWLFPGWSAVSYKCGTLVWHFLLYYTF